MTQTQLDKLWQRRHQPEALESLRHELEPLLGPPDDYEPLWRWARLQHFLGMQAGEDNARATAHYEAGRGAGERAMTAIGHGVEGHFWYGVNLIEGARRHGTLAGAKALPIANKHIERAMKIDESYYFAGPLRVWGRLTHLKPLLLGGSTDRALNIYRRALQIAPHNSTTLLYFGEALLADRQPAEARSVLKQLVAASDDADWVWEQQRDRKLAGELLQTF